MPPFIRYSLFLVSILHLVIRHFYFPVKTLASWCPERLSFDDIGMYTCLRMKTLAPKVCFLLRRPRWLRYAISRSKNSIKISLNGFLTLLGILIDRKSLPKTIIRKAVVFKKAASSHKDHQDSCNYVFFKRKIIFFLWNLRF